MLISNKMDLRHMAVSLALNVEGVTNENIIAVAKEVESYILGDSKLPEVGQQDETMSKVAEMLAKSYLPNTTSDEKGVEERTSEVSATE